MGKFCGHKFVFNLLSNDFPRYLTSSLKLKYENKHVNQIEGQSIKLPFVNRVD